MPTIPVADYDTLCAETKKYCPEEFRSLTSRSRRINGEVNVPEKFYERCIGKIEEQRKRTTTFAKQTAEDVDLVRRITKGIDWRSE